MRGVAGVTLSLVSVFVLVTGCAPQPEPVESQGPFATEEEAFAAAEETYRNYVEALNAVDLSDPETFEPVYEWTTGAANAEARESFSQWHADGWRVNGASVIQLAEPSLADASDTTYSVELAVCLDVSAVTLVDEEGQSAVSPDRPSVQSMLVTVVPAESAPNGWGISAFDGRDGDPACG